MMNSELSSYLETIEPELRVLTRLFGFPESVWDEPKKFFPKAEERDCFFRIVFRRTIRIRASASFTAGAPPAACASRRCTISCAV